MTHIIWVILIIKCRTKNHSSRPDFGHILEPPDSVGGKNLPIFSELKILTEADNWMFKFYKDSARYDYQLNTLEQVMAVSPLQYTNEVV